MVPPGLGVSHSDREWGPQAGDPVPNIAVIFKIWNVVKNVPYSWESDLKKCTIQIKTNKIINAPIFYKCFLENYKFDNFENLLLRFCGLQKDSIVHK